MFCADRASFIYYLLHAFMFPFVMGAFFMVTALLLAYPISPWFRGRRRGR
ncbi:hypothetical protein KK141_11040 [Dyella sp. LX-66]|nr:MULTISPECIES: hypothetical protein [unclassified Dyella]MBT2118940.1 hypothetical protein [Dyella sp. LX-1]MBT2140066.1 hypothetical protein [Dyella sp. LX-66]